VALAPDATVYVGDNFSHTVEAFAPDGTFLRELGSAGTGSGQLSSVGGLAVDAAGNVYVADSSNRVERFAADGSFLGSFGGKGGDPGQFFFGAGSTNQSPAGGGLAIAGDQLFVADTRNHRVQRMGLDGSSPLAFGSGDLLYPQGLTVAADRVVVADDQHHRLALYSTDGQLTGSLGNGPGSGPGQLRNPYDVGADAAGDLFVADNLNHRVDRFDPLGNATSFGTRGTAPGQLAYPRGIAVAADGTSYVADTSNNRISVFDGAGNPLRQFGTSSRAPGQYTVPMGIAGDPGSLRAVADSVSGRVQVLAPDGSVLAIWGAPSPEPTQLLKPVAVAFAPDQTAWALDQGRSRVVHYGRDGTQLGTMGDGVLSAPSALAGDAAGNLYVADTGNGRVAVFAPDGSSRSLGAFTTASGIAVTPDGSRIYVADRGTNRITVLGPDGATLDAFAAGSLPTGLALDAEGDLWVAERGSDRVQRLSPSGHALASYGTRGTEAGEFVHPSAVAVDCAGTVTVADTDNNRLQQLAGAAPATGCATPLPVSTEPAPVVTTPPPPPPAPPQLTVRSARTRHALTPLGITVHATCDVACRLRAAGTVVPLRTHRGRPLLVRLRAAARTLSAGRRATIRFVVPRRRLPALRRALRGHVGLVAQLQLTASVAGAPPTLVTKRLLVRR
jgi:tripartite motif-containing protein 71